jgi:hypothetical protein
MCEPQDSGLHRAPQHVDREGGAPALGGHRGGCLRPRRALAIRRRKLSGLKLQAAPRELRDPLWTRQAGSGGSCSAHRQDAVCFLALRVPRRLVIRVRLGVR